MLGQKGIHNFAGEDQIKKFGKETVALQRKSCPDWAKIFSDT